MQGFVLIRVIQEVCFEWQISEFDGLSGDASPRRSLLLDLRAEFNAHPGPIPVQRTHTLFFFLLFSQVQRRLAVCEVAILFSSGMVSKYEQTGAAANSYFHYRLICRL